LLAPVQREATPLERPAARRAPPLPAREPSVEAPPPEPVINVTIGRIEIRATNAPAPPKRTAAATPALSLDDYLNKGGRR
jgi:hypothetical protein